ncbi:MAG: prepilin-type N-terminal cleavage/methylation domain-containing protein [Thermoanaerobaculia bacterium]
MQREKNGFTLIELLIVVAIIGVIAAIAIPNLITAMNRARQKRTMADMRQIGMAWESRSVDMGRYAAAGLTLECDVPVTMTNAKSLLEPTFINPMPERDGWENAFEFAVNAGGSQYLIRSYGRHGVRDEEVAGGGSAALDCDILYSGGQFLQYPEGVQSQ